MKLQRISGTWFDFYHCNPYEGDTWNATTQQFTAEDWELKLGEMAEAGMDTLVLLHVALHGQAFYPSEVIPHRWNTVCPDPLEAVLAAADKHGQTIYVGLGFFTTPIMGSLSTTGDRSSLRFDIARELAARYGHHRSFGGWYFPVEAAIFTYFPDHYVTYANELADFCRKVGAPKVLIAPYGTRSINGDGRFVAQLRSLEVDYIAYQDEIGVDRTTFEQVEATFERLREAHDRANKPLWADIEVFRFQGRVLYPGAFDRIQRQLEIVSPYVDKVLCYQYLGMMNKPGSPVHAGSAESVALYEDYTAYMKEQGLLPR
ncbi:twin-arginine translocation pathway signal protein [Paenibacillus sp. J31TS4]|uniref:DUF4434 domain-containing protein n=1 Tax=Paenibacillus sp. J31TS4 TaxID=2807195 RepID=UPI001B18E79B|nr:DUF4434 domain-containing protein [Paenibacillus sp. J31TS4]GIP38998.1 twin-arginine translocation pathway signal protein [Paenibacillus sp. J31TS4]